jgi:hypothetical protein
MKYADSNMNEFGQLQNLPDSCFPCEEGEKSDGVSGDERDTKAEDM